MIRIPTPQDFVDTLASGNSVIINDEFYKIKAITVPPPHQRPPGVDVIAVLFADGTELILKQEITGGSNANP